MNISEAVCLWETWGTELTDKIAHRVLQQGEGRKGETQVFTGWRTLCVEHHVKDNSGESLPQT